MRIATTHNNGWAVGARDCSWDNEIGDVEDYTINFIDSIYVNHTQSYNTCLKAGDVNEEVSALEIISTHPAGTQTITQVDFNTNGTTNAGDIINAKVWYTNTNPLFEGCAVNPILFGTVANPSGNFSVTGSQILLY